MLVHDSKNEIPMHILFSSVLAGVALGVSEIAPTLYRLHRRRRPPMNPVDGENEQIPFGEQMDQNPGDGDDGDDDLSWTTRLVGFGILVLVGTVAVYAILKHEQDAKNLEDYFAYVSTNPNNTKTYSEYLQTVKNITLPNASLSSSLYYLNHVPTFEVD